MSNLPTCHKKQPHQQCIAVSSAVELIRAVQSGKSQCICKYKSQGGPKGHVCSRCNSCTGSARGYEAVKSCSKKSELDSTRGTGRLQRQSRNSAKGALVHAELQSVTRRTNRAQLLPLKQHDCLQRMGGCVLCRTRPAPPSLDRAPHRSPRPPRHTCGTQQRCQREVMRPAVAGATKNSGVVRLMREQQWLAPSFITDVETEARITRWDPGRRVHIYR